MKTNYTVYVVDNDNLNLRIITRKLRRELNCEALGFSSPELCLVAVESKTPDLVLADCSNEDNTTGRMSGEQMLAQLKNDFPKLPVIMYSSIESMDLAVKMLNGGANNFVPKQVYFMQNITAAVKSEIIHVRERSREKAVKSWMAVLIVVLLGAVFYLNFVRSEWLMEFMIAFLVAGLFFVLWGDRIAALRPRRRPARKTSDSLT